MTSGPRDDDDTADPLAQTLNFKDIMAPEVVPFLLEKGLVRPNKHRVVDGEGLLERVENALTLVRRQAVSGERLVVKVGA